MYLSFDFIPKSQIIVIIMKTSAPESINEMLMAQRHNNAKQFLETNMILQKLDNNDTMYW